MIAYLKGEILEISGKSLILLVGGVGYRVFATEETVRSASVGAEFSLHTYMAVRENAIELYGFKDKEALHFFEMLITIPGIGPKSALSILNIASLDSLRSAVASGDTGYLTKVSGIGRKTAERVIVELKGKLKDQALSAPVAKEHSDALDALAALGYSQQEARDALKTVPKETSNLQEKIKIALRNLGK